MGRSRPWRDDELKDVTHLYLNTSMTIDEIAQRTGRTRASVDARLGIRQRQKHRPYTEEERTYIKSVIRQKSLREIAFDLNRSYDSVRQFIRLNGIRRALTKQEREAIIAFIAERLNVTQNWDVITYDVVVKFGITTNKHALYQRWCYYTKNKGAAYAQIPSLDR